MAERARAGTTQAIRQPKPMSATTREKLAKQGLVRALAATNEKAAVTAVLEAVNERLTWDTSLRERIRENYDDLAALALATSKPKAERGPSPKPVSGRNLKRFSGFTTLDPYNLLAEFGREGLRGALADATQRLLRQGVDAVQAREPNSKPRSKSANQDMVDYIVEHVAGPGY